MNEIIIKAGGIDDALDVEAGIPEYTSRHTVEDYIRQFGSRESLVLVAEFDGIRIAFQTGYAVSESEFVIWSGGVIPGYRHHGIARQLVQKFEEWARERNYSLLTVKSTNRFPNMLVLLIQNGYLISGYEDNGDLSCNVIFLKKNIH